MDYVPRPGRLWRSKTDFFKPFRSAASEVGENITPLYDPALAHQAKEEEEPDLRDLNEALKALVDVFPDIQPEVFREMLLNVSEESRLQVVTEQLLKKKAKFVGGRFRPGRSGKAAIGSSGKGAGSSHEDHVLPIEETFRGENYRKAAKQLLYQEFKNLSHSTVRGVMAENNYSYTRSRSTLQELASKSWRFSFSAFWTKKSAAGVEADHPGLIWQGDTSLGFIALPAVKRTGSTSLDQELHELLVQPVLTHRREEQLAADRTYALKLNEAEAEELGDVYDCECCYSSVPFEQVATCDDGCHYLCFNCIRRTTHEAVYGQGWARSIDLEKSTVRCFAPTARECHGSLPADLVKRALHDGSGKGDVWLEFQKRAASEVLIKSRVPLQRCPFCIYGEVDETPAFKLRTAGQIWRHLTTKASAGFQLMLLAALLVTSVMTMPVILLASFLYLIVSIFPPATQVLTASWTRVHKSRRTLRFHCLNPSCSRTSCTRCLSPWQDPHTCFDTERTSLRTAIESSATLAIKRTCPKCLLSFVKSSGCNKLVCNCGYTMCYICRQEITSKEGYAHFCQHFRPSGGRCEECERCDLYGDEDEEGVIRRAAERAERVWRENEGGEGSEEVARAMVEALVGKGKRRWWEEWMDTCVDAVAA